MKHFFPYLLVIGFALALLSACNTDDPFSFRNDFSTVPDARDTTGVTRIVRSSGLVIYVHDPGAGPYSITERDAIQLFYTFRLTNGEIVESTYANGQTFPSTLDMRGVIRGFREGLVGIKEDGVVTLVIPPSLGYGNSQNSPFRNDTLLYEIEVVRILD